MNDRPRGAVFDLGGVVFESPLHAISAFEVETGLPNQTVASIVSEEGADGAWSRLERGEISLGDFTESFASEFSDRGFKVDVRMLMHRVESSLVVRPAVVTAIERLRAHGVVVAALTNNWTPMSHLEIAGHFDVFVESVVEGVRKPEPEIYLRTAARLGVATPALVMLDDLGVNLKSARSLGMITYKVDDPADAIAWLDETFDLRLAGL